MRIALAGGTGTVGRHVTETARAAGHDVTVLSRSTGTDLTTGDGLAQALDGCDAVIDVSSKQTLSSRGSVEFLDRDTEPAHR
jgi:nucleoside-diphosphate-sugar epimerase